MKKLIVLSVVAALLLGGCGSGATPESDAAETSTPEPSLTTHSVAAEATIEPARWSELRFEIIHESIEFFRILCSFTYGDDDLLGQKSVPKSIVLDDCFALFRLDTTFLGVLLVSLQLLL